MKAKKNKSPFIRAIGFLYVRYTQPPESLWSWFEKFLDDTEEFYPSSGGGPKMTFGEMARNLLTKLDWFTTLFPRIPVAIQKDIQQKISDYDANYQPEYSQDEGHHDDRRHEDSKDYDEEESRSSNREDYRHKSGGDRKRDDRHDDRHHSNRDKYRDRSPVRQQVKT